MDSLVGLRLDLFAHRLVRRYDGKRIDRRNLGICRAAAIDFLIVFWC